MTDFEKFVEYLKSDNVLFHYTKLRTGLEKILINKQLKYNMPSKFMDILETTLPAAVFRASPDYNLNANNYKIFMQQARKKLEQLGVICFCSNDQQVEMKKVRKNYCDILDIITKYQFYYEVDIEIFKLLYGYEKNRMWEQYANNSKGLCLVFDKNILIKTIKENSNLLKHGYVNYMANPNMYYNNGGLEIDNLQEKYISNFVANKLLSKHYDYKEENEYRVIVKLYGVEPQFISIEDSLKAVIITSSLSPKKIKILTQLLDQYPRSVKLVEYKIKSSLPRLLPLND